MGLGDIVPDEAQDDEDDSGSSSSGSSSGGGGPGVRYFQKQPQAILYEDQDGYWHLKKAPSTPEVRWMDHPQVTKPDEEITWRHVWWTQDELKLENHKLETVTGRRMEDFDDPEKLHEAIIKTAREYVSDSNVEEAQKQRRCAVCDEYVDLYEDDYEEFENQIVHDSHSVRELQQNDVI